MRKDLQPIRQVDHAEALQKAQSGHCGIKIQSRGKSGSKDKAEGFDRIHGLCASYIGLGDSVQGITNQRIRGSSEVANPKKGTSRRLTGTFAITEVG